MLDNLDREIAREVIGDFEALASHFDGTASSVAIGRDDPAYLTFQRASEAATRGANLVRRLVDEANG
jgi:hypothetical protein